jgi:hypothetical protein
LELELPLLSLLDLNQEHVNFLLLGLQLLVLEMILVLLLLVGLLKHLVELLPLEIFPL